MILKENISLRQACVSNMRDSRPVRKRTDCCPSSGLAIEYVTSMGTEIRKTGLEDALDRVREVVGDTLAYMRHMETAPPLLADGLSGDYRLLAEYSGTVLAGHQTKYGVQFATWDRLQDGTLWQGHYFNPGEGIDAAKRDFTTRSGLIPAILLFTREQLAVIFDAAQNMAALDLVSNPEQGKLLEGIMRQIEEAVPQVIDLANELTQTPRQQEPGEMQL